MSVSQAVPGNAADGASTALLGLLAFLGPTPLPERIFDEHQALLPPSLREPSSRRTAITQLKHSKYVRSGEMGLVLDDELAAVTRASLDGEESGEHCALALRLVTAAFPDEPDDIATWPMCETLLPHARTVVAHSSHLLPRREEARWLRDRAAVYMVGQGQHEEALELVLPALRDAQRNDPGGALTGTLHRTLACIRDELGQRHAARRTLERALEIHGDACGPGSTEIVRDRIVLAKVLENLGDLEAALREIDEATAAANGIQPPDLSICDAWLAAGWLRLRADDPDGARTAFERALAIAEETLRHDHLSAGSAHSGLGQVLQRRPETRQQAVDELRRALSISEAMLGEDHPDVGIDRSNLGSALHGLAELDEARLQLEQALAAAEQVEPPNAQTLCIRHRKLASLLRDMGDLQAARRHAERAAELGGHRHAGDLALLAGIRLELDDAAAAAWAYDRALEVAEKADDARAIDVARYHLGRGRAARSAGDLRTARAHLSRARSAYEAAEATPAQGETDARMGIALLTRELGDELAAAYDATGDRQRADRTRSETAEFVEELMRRELATDDLDGLLSLARACIRAGGWEEAEAALTQADEVVVGKSEDSSAQRRLSLALAWHDLGRACMSLADQRARAVAALESAHNLYRDQWLQGVVLHDLAAIRRDEGDHGRAIDLFRRAAVLKRDAGGETRDLATTLHSLGRALERRGNELAGDRSSERAECFEEALEVYKERLSILEALTPRNGQMEGVTLHDIADVERARPNGDLSRAIEYYGDAAKRKQEADGRGDGQDLAFTLLRLGRSLEEAHRFREALSIYEQRLEILESSASREPVAEGVALHDIGDILAKRSRFEDAVDAYREAAERKRAGGDASGESLANTLVSLSQALIMSESPEEAKAAAWEAEAVAQEETPDSLETKLAALLLVAEAALRTQAPELALAALRDADALFDDTRSLVEKAGLAVMHWRAHRAADSDSDVVDAARARGKTALAEALEHPSAPAWEELAVASALATEMELPDLARQAARRARDLGDPHGPERTMALADVLLSLGRAERAHGDVEEALAAYEERLALLEDLSDVPPRALAITFHDIGRLHQGDDRHADAAKHYGKAVEMWRQAAPPKQRDLARTLLAHARATLTTGESHTALVSLEEAWSIARADTHLEPELVEDIRSELQRARRAAGSSD